MWTPGRSKNGMFEFKHKNGLKLLLVPRSGLDVTTANITYHVGSRNEGLGMTGATHYLEHGMFKGSKKFNGKNGMWKLEELGAYMNATTYVDRTNYFEVIETKYLKSAIEREGDRMLQPLLTKELLDSEMSVVRNEYERGENNDFEWIHKRLMATAFMAHPYHHSTIGWKSDIENVSADALKAFHDIFYVPNNATYTFVGNFDPEHIKDMVNEHFSAIPKGNKIPDMYTEEPLQMGQRRVHETRESNAAMMGIGFKAPAGLHRDAIVLEVVAELLTSGPEAVVADLKKEGTVHDVIASWERMKDPFIFTVWATTNYPTKEAVERAEIAISNIIKNYPKPTEKRLTAVKTGIKFNWQSAMEGTRGMAAEINEAIARGDAFDVINRFTILDSITTDDVKRVADKYFDFDKSTVAIFHPGNAGVQNITNEKYTTPKYQVSPLKLKVPQSTTLNFYNASDVKDGYTFTQYGNTSKTHIILSTDIDTSFSVDNVITRTLLSQMMAKGVHLNDSEFGEKNVVNFLQNNGVQRQIVNSTSGVSFQLAIPNGGNVVEKTIRLMQAELQTPTLKKSDFTYLKSKLQGELNGKANDVDETSKTAFYASLFQKGDANYRYTSRELSSALRDLTHNDVLKEHALLMQKGKNRITILGPNQIIPNLKTQTIPYTFKRIRNNTSDSIKRIFISGKQSCTVNIGMEVNPSMDLIIATGALGSGFSGRLMKIVRDKHGLTYGIGAYIKKRNGTGILNISATFNPKLLDEGLNLTNKLVKQWFTGDLTQEEVDIQKQMLIGARKVQFDNTAAMANIVHIAQIRGEGVQSIDDFAQTVNKVTLQSAIHSIKSLRITDMRTVIAGTLLS